MKYTNEQRIEKIKNLIEKLQKYIDDNEITRKDVTENERTAFGNIIICYTLCSGL